MNKENTWCPPRLVLHETHMDRSYFIHPHQHLKSVCCRVTAVAKSSHVSNMSGCEQVFTSPRPNNKKRYAVERFNLEGWNSALAGAIRDHLGHLR